jgi:lipoprotein-anchoring transpeptidase ErfK/SrfK
MALLPSSASAMRIARVIMSLLVLLVCSCKSPQPETNRAEAGMAGLAIERPLFEWHGDGVAGPVSVVISVSEQKAYIFRGGNEVGWTYVATGKRSHPSPRGSFQVLEKLRHKRSNRYGTIIDASGVTIDSDATAGREAIPPGGRFVGASMPWWMRITSWGVGMHAGPIPHPGSPASHGCIRLPPEMARTLFSLVKIGTPVSIR